MAHERQAQQAWVGQQALDDLIVAHAQVPQAGVAIGAALVVEQGARPVALAEAAQLAGRRRASARRRRS